MPPGRPIKDVFNPCAGVRNDFAKLLKLFTETKSVRYDQFSEIWRDLKMSFIFTGRETERELREFTEDVLAIAVDFWMPPATFQNRVGALYLLYGLYFKQMSEPRCKIRITIEMWNHIVDFMAEVKRQQHLDVEYCYYKLCYYRAFHYVASPAEQITSREQVSADGTKTKDELDKIKVLALAEQKSLVSEILEPDSIDQLSAIHEQYHQIKCLLSGKNATVPDRSLNVIEANLVQHITKTVATFEDWRKKKASGQKIARRRRDSGTSVTTSDSEGESQCETEMQSQSGKAKSSRIRRAEIRARAFSSTAGPSKVRRHRRIGKRYDELDDTASSDTGSPKKKRPRKSRNSSQRKDDHGHIPEVLIKQEVIEEGVNLLDMPLLEDIQPSPSPKRKQGNHGAATKN